MSDQVEINGNLHSWGSISVKFGGDRFFGFKSIKYGDARERVKGYGMGRQHGPRGRSRGKYTTEPVVLAGHPSSIQELREALAAASQDGVSYGDVEFDIVVQYVEPGEVPITVEIERCAWAKNSTSNEEGPDPLTEEIEIDCFRIRRNGTVLWDASEGG
jgi:hypothetical protein